MFRFIDHLPSSQSRSFNQADLIRLAYRILIRHPRSTPEFIRAHQNRQLRRLVTYAYHKTVFYRRHFDQAGLKPTDIMTIADLAKIPITTRDDLQEHGLEMLSHDFRPADLQVFKSSGSSGKPVCVKLSVEEQFIKLMFRLRYLRYWGARPLDRHVNLHLAGRKRARAFETLQKVVHGLGLSVNTPVDCRRPVEEIASEVRRISPDILIGYAGSLHSLADHMSTDGGHAIRPRFVMSGAEELTDDMRRTIGQAFQAPVYNYYGSWEMGAVAWECKTTGLLHTNDDGVILEILKDGRPAAPGEQGEVIGTNLAALAMPMIRYQQGDLVVRGPKVCACGLPFGTISQISGRVNDVFVLPTGETVNYYGVLQFLDHEVQLIRQFQLIQEDLHHLNLKIVPRREIPPKMLKDIGKRVLDRLGEQVEFNITLVDSIPPEPGGKFKRVISRVSR
jgi:phenylacetate-CoA ligase